MIRSILYESHKMSKQNKIQGFTQMTRQKWLSEVNKEMVKGRETDSGGDNQTVKEIKIESAIDKTNKGDVVSNELC